MSKTTVGDNPNYEGETKENEIDESGKSEIKTYGSDKKRSENLLILVEEYDPAGKVQDIGVRNPNFENDEKIKNVPETQADQIISIESESLASIIDETTTPVSTNSKISPEEELVNPGQQPVEPEIQPAKPETEPVKPEIQPVKLEIQPENAQSSGLEDFLSGSGNDLLSPVTEPEKPETQPPGSSLDLLGNSLL